MKRKLIALAVASVFVAPAAMADTGNVTLYGVIDASFDATNTGTAPGVNSVSTTKVSSSQSRIGFKGTEDVGGGTNVLWQIENGINSDGAAGTWNNRNTFVGLSGDSWGTVLLGNNDSPYKSATRGMDLFADTIADNRNIMGLATAAGAVSNAGTAAAPNPTAQFDGRMANSVTYTTPDLGGIKISGQYVAAAESTTTQAQTKGSAYALSGVYASGPITGALAYAVHDFGTTGTGSLGAGAAVAGDINKKERAFKIAGGYAVDQFTVNLVFEKSTDDFQTPAVAGQSASSDRKAWYLAGKYNLSGTDAVKLAYTSAGSIGNPAANNTSVKQISVGYDHAMSKRTKIYALWSKVTNEDSVGGVGGATYGLGTAVSTGAVAAVAGGSDPSAVSIGIKHSF